MAQKVQLAKEKREFGLRNPDSDDVGIAFQQINCFVIFAIVNIRNTIHVRIHNFI